MSTPDRSTNWAGSRGEKWAKSMEGMHATLSPIDAPLLDALDLTTVVRVADVGCGGGATTRRVAELAPAGSVIHGYDLSPVLVSIAAQSTPDGVRFSVADMALAEPPADRCDRLVSRFGIMFFEEPLAAFSNLRRWLRPEGSFAFAAWGPPQENAWLELTRNTVGEFVELPKPDYSEPGPFRYAEPDVLLGLLRDAGFEGVSATPWRGQFLIGGGLAPESAAAFAIEAFGMFAELLEEAGAGVRERAEQVLCERFAEHVAEGHVQLSASVNIYTGTNGTA